MYMLSEMVSTRLAEGDIDTLINAVANNDPGLEQIIIESPSINAVKAIQLLQAAQSNTHIVHIELTCSNPSTDEAQSIIRDGAKAIYHLLKDNKRLKKLHLNNLQIKCHGCFSVAEGLAHNTTLESLTLSDCGIGPRSIDDLCLRLSHHNTTLQSLTLEDRNLGPQDAEKLLRLPTNRPTITSMGIGVTQINEDGVLKALALNQQLTTLSVRQYNHPLAEPAATCIAELVRSSTNLKHLRITADGYDDNSLDTLYAAIKEDHKLLGLDLYYYIHGKPASWGLPKAINDKLKFNRGLVYYNYEAHEVIFMIYLVRCAIEKPPISRLPNEVLFAIFELLYPAQIFSHKSNQLFHSMPRSDARLFAGDAWRLARASGLTLFRTELESEGYCNFDSNKSISADRSINGADDILSSGYAQNTASAHDETSEDEDECFEDDTVYPFSWTPANYLMRNPR